MTDLITLVVDSSALERLRLDERSVLVKAYGRSEQRVPLARLLRVDVTGTPHSGMECLLELASRSIPVTFFCASGAVRAQLYHPTPRPTPLAHWMSELFTAQGESPTYRAWRENHLRAIFRTVGIHGGSLEQQAREHRDLLHAQLRRRMLCECYVELLPVQAGLVDARIGEQLLRFGVPPGSPARAQLVRDLAGLCTRWLLSRTVHWLVHLEPGDDATRFERYLRCLCSNALDEWLFLVLGRLAERAASGALHQDAA